MLAILYISIMHRDYNEIELEEMLKTFRFNNNKHNITGLMLYHEANVIQYIEGSDEHITKLYDNIKNDPRHSYIITLLCHKSLEDDVSEKIFKDWNLGFSKINKENFIEFTKLNFEECASASLVKKLFYNYINTHLPSAMI